MSYPEKLTPSEENTNEGKRVWSMEANPTIPWMTSFHSPLLVKLRLLSTSSLVGIETWKVLLMDLMKAVIMGDVTLPPKHTEISVLYSSLQELER